MRYLRKLISGIIVGVGLVLGLAAGMAVANNISQFTGPSGSNPVNFPAALNDLNKLINTINANLSPGGTGTMASFFTLNGAIPALQITQANSFTATTSSCTGSSAFTNMKQCLVILNSSGVTRYIPIF